ncbi:MAG: hypothetical protein RIS35_2859 [Pseudomonadota bacterium]|jgi:hypothetical protein
MLTLLMDLGPDQPARHHFDISVRVVQALREDGPLSDRRLKWPIPSRTVFRAPGQLTWPDPAEARWIRE